MSSIQVIGVAILFLIGSVIWLSLLVDAARQDEDWLFAVLIVVPLVSGVLMVVLG